MYQVKWVSEAQYLGVTGCCRSNDQLPLLKPPDSSLSVDGKAAASKLCTGVVFATPVTDARLERCAIPQLQNFRVTSRIKHRMAKLPWLKCRTAPFARWMVKDLRN